MNSGVTESLKQVYLQALNEAHMASHKVDFFHAAAWSISVFLKRKKDMVCLLSSENDCTVYFRQDWIFCGWALKDVLTQIGLCYTYSYSKISGWEITSNETATWQHGVKLREHLNMTYIILILCAYCTWLHAVTKATKALAWQVLWMLSNMGWVKVILYRRLWVKTRS